MATQTLKQGDTFQGGVVNFDAQTGKPLLPGQTTTLPVSPSIAAENIGTSPLKIPVIPPSSDPLTGYLTAANTETTNAKTDVATAETAVKNSTDEIANLQTSLENQTPDRLALEANAGIPTLNADIRDLESLSKKQFATYLDNYNKTEQQAVPLGVIQTQQTEQTRQHGIDALLTNSLISAKRGDLTTAQDSVDRAISAKYDPIKAKIQNKLDFLKINYDNLSRADKKLADAKEKEWNLQIKNMDIARENEQNATSLIAKMAANGVSNSVLLDMQKKVKEGASPLDIIQLGAKYLVDPMAKVDMAIKQQQLLKLKKETSLLGEPTDAEKKASTAALKEAKSSLPVMQDKIAAVNVLEEHPGLSSRVGTNFLSRTPQGEGILGNTKQFLQNIIKAPLTLGIGSVKDAKSSITGQGQDFAGGVHKLVGGLTLDNLIAAKARGATFGALSEGELSILASSATAINDWEIKDSKGKGTGVWNIDEKSFKKELDTIKTLTNRAITLSKEQIFSSDEQSVLDTAFGTADTALSPGQYFNQ